MKVKWVHAWRPRHMAMQAAAVAALCCPLGRSAPHRSVSGIRVQPLAAGASATAAVSTATAARAGVSTGAGAGAGAGACSVPRHVPLMALPWALAPAPDVFR